MSITDIITLLQRRLANLGALRSSAVLLGDLNQIERLDAEIGETEATLTQLLTLVN